MKKWVLLFVMMVFIFSMAIVDAAENRELSKAVEEAAKVQKVGPVEIPLLDQAKFKLPANFIFIPQPQADKIMTSLGNGKDENLIGIIGSQNDNEDWMITVEYRPAGYIEDSEAKDWDVDELFESVKKGTEEGNKDRQKRGIPELEVVGWVEKPQYDASTHQLIWSMSARDKGQVNSEPSVNYNTYKLGREGYLILRLITDLKSVEAEKPVAKQLLGAIEYAPGKRYEDFDKSKDKVAEYGIAALVAGAAAKKLGLFAIVAGFAAKFAKLIVVAVAAVGAGIAKLFGRKKSKTDVSTEEQTQPENKEEN